MPELLSAGFTYTLTQNITYALPAVAAYIFGQGATYEISNDGTTWQAVTLDTNKGLLTAARFIRSTAVASNVTVKRS